MDESVKLVEKGIGAAPPTYSEAQVLLWALEETHEIIDRNKPQGAAMKVAEAYVQGSYVPTATLRRRRVEGAVMAAVLQRGNLETVPYMNSQMKSKWTGGTASNLEDVLSASPLAALPMANFKEASYAALTRTFHG